MDRKSKEIYAPNLIRICVEQIRNADYVGNIFHPYDCQAIAFRDSRDLLKKMDQFYDECNFPQASTHRRTFNSDIKPAARGKYGKGFSTNMEHMQDKNGAQGTFVVHVMYRQNSSWQGEVIWVDKKKKRYFRSALEFLKLIDSAIEESDEQNEIGSCDWDFDGEYKL